MRFLNCILLGFLFLVENNVAAMIDIPSVEARIVEDSTLKFSILQESFIGLLKRNVAQFPLGLE